MADVLVLSADAGLITALRALAASAGVTLRVAGRAADVDARTRGEVPLLLVGGDALEEALQSWCATADGLGARPGIAVVSPEVTERVWAGAAALAAEVALELPTGAPWLAARLPALAGADGRGPQPLIALVADAGVRRVEAGVPSAAGLAGAQLSHRAPPPPAAHCRQVAVVGGQGGAGASVLSASLALAAAARGSTVTLIDADPLGGGLDVLLGVEGSAGLRWCDLVRPEAVDNPPSRLAQALREGLPAANGVRVLSYGDSNGYGDGDRGDWYGHDGESDSNGDGHDAGESDAVPGAALAAVLAAAAHTEQLIVVDAGRAWALPAGGFAAPTWTVVLVAVNEVRGCAAAGRVLARLGDQLDVRLVVRVARGRRIRATRVADALGLPLSATLPTDRGVSSTVEYGRLAMAPLPRALRQVSQRLLADLLDPVHPAVPGRGTDRPPAGERCDLTSSAGSAPRYRGEAD